MTSGRHQSWFGFMTLRAGLAFSNSTARTTASDLLSSHLHTTLLLLDSFSNSPFVYIAMRLPQNQLRLIAIPVILCATWFFDCRKLIDELLVPRTSETHVKGPKKDKLRSKRTPSQDPARLYQDEIQNVIQQALGEYESDDDIESPASEDDVEPHSSSGGTTSEDNVGPPDSNGTALENGKVEYDYNEKTSAWYASNKAVRALEEDLSTSLTEEEKKNWFTTPSFHPFPKKPNCPSPNKFVKSKINFKELDFTDEQQEKLRKELQQGSTTIRKAFEPWIEKGGFHPDLILHAGHEATLYVGIFNNNLYFSGGYHSKVGLLAEHLESVLYEFRKQKVDIPDIVFPYSVRSIPSKSLTYECAKYSTVPEHLQDRYDTIPIACIAMDPTIHNGPALVPNMYFANLKVWDLYTKTLLQKFNVPWNERKKRVFWRGKVARKLEANIPRLEALQANARDVKTSTGHLDIALTSGCGFVKEYAKNVTQTSPLAPKWLPKDYFIKQTHCGGHMRTPHAQFPNYWAQLNLPGSSLGSYSKNLQNLFATGAAVMIWNQSAVEFYYDTLKPGITHVYVNETTIEPMAAKLFENKGKLAQLMGEVSKEWFEENLTSKAMLEYYRQWFQAWGALQRFKPTPEMLKDACTCSGWIDAGKDKKQSRIKRCSFCAKYPIDVNKGCTEMMGMREDPSVCL